MKTSIADPGENYIILVFKDSLPQQDKVLLKDILTEIGRAKQVDDFPRKITFTKANKILMHGKKDSSKDQSCTAQSLLPERRKNMTYKYLTLCIQHPSIT